MNQDQVKDILLQLDGEVEEFSLLFSGKTSKKVNGLYKPDIREIIIHNKNFSKDGELIYTAIHEFAHHVHMTRSAVPVGPRAHTREFRAIFHGLLARAESMGLYSNPVAQEGELAALAGRIKRDYLSQHGKLIKDFGKVLIEAQRLCMKYNTRFEDFCERSLAIDKSTAMSMMRIAQLDVNPDIGYENMKTVAGIRKGSDRKAAEEAFAAGESPDLVKTRFQPAPVQQDKDPRKVLEAERKRIARTLERLQERLREIDDRLEREDTYPNSP